MEVLLADLADAEAILALQKEAYLSEAQLHDDFAIPPMTQTLSELKQDFSSRVVLKILNEDLLVASGQARLVADTCHIARMAVKPALQGQGVGSRMLRALEDVFPHANRFELFTGHKSVANLTMYKNRGYVPFKEEQLGKTTIIFLEKFNN